jgi:hypothetical protein
MMNEEIKYFKCVKDGGCRLADLNLNLVKDQKFCRDFTVAETSRSIQAALKSGWINELTKDEFLK